MIYKYNNNNIMQVIQPDIIIKDRKEKKISNTKHLDMEI